MAHLQILKAIRRSNSQPSRPVEKRRFGGDGAEAMPIASTQEILQGTA
jgi:hypothetical protein